ncbi:phage tail sheath family protein [Bacteroides intestinalis]|uniref:phage tail sheath family protein n=1 Tax=Bacteroides intestinalis TaxID=329854 RepID=UPI00189F74A5|nr:phage tail sheath C-terminal domain-containing protein [Bacteroides intestinalis]
MGEYKTPGVYIKEKNAFGNSVVEAETAIPVFIGLTEKTKDGNTSLLYKPVKISSLTEYTTRFGGAPTPKFELSVIKEAPADTTLSVFDKEQGVGLQAELKSPLCTLYYHLMLFFANGGGTCYIVSIGNYQTDFLTAYTAQNIWETVSGNIKKEPDITLLVVPEAVNVGKEETATCMNAYKNLLMLCDSKKYFALLDIPKDLPEKETRTPVDYFREEIGATNLQFAAAYYPWLETSVLTDKDIDGEILSWQSVPDEAVFGDNKKMYAYTQTCLDKLMPQPDAAKKVAGDEIRQLKNTLHDTMSQNWPLYKLLVKKVKDYLNLLPPSAAMAGIYTMVDHTRGVWKAPANVSVNYVNKPSEAITDTMQEDLNMPVTGKAVNAIRTFPGEGIKVWGARTLDGNSQDWRYINVRRTMTFLEQSVKNAARAYVFEPNDANTWIVMKCMVENFLRSVWKRGGLAGATPEDAYEVHVGLGDTMTAEDILEGTMRISVLVAISRPAEFIEITFQQQMQKS